MQDAAAEVGELGGLVEAHGGDAARGADDARVGGHDAVGVGPDLDLLGGERGADQGRREVAAVAAHGRDLAALRLADEARDDGHDAGLDLLGVQARILASQPGIGRAAPKVRSVTKPRSQTSNAWARRPFLVKKSAMTRALMRSPKLDA